LTIRLKIVIKTDIKETVIENLELEVRYFTFLQCETNLKRFVNPIKASTKV